MLNSQLIRLIIIGALAIAGVIFIQSYWVIKTLDIEEQAFSQKVNGALRDVAASLSEINDFELPKTDLIKKERPNYYAVNINNLIPSVAVLEDLLYTEFQEHRAISDFEYAVYDCHSEELVYGNFCKLSDEQGSEIQKSENLPALKGLTYYFVVKFPSREQYLLSRMSLPVLFSFISLLAVFFFVYAISIILKQKRLTELQKDFINNMTHEFKTPISSIKIASEVLSNHGEIKNDRRLSQYVGIVQDQNERLNNQVEKVLNIAKLEAESYKLNKVALNLQEELNEIVRNENLRITETQKGHITFKTTLADVIAEADKVHLHNCIYSIIDNAVKYSEKFCEIVVELKEKSGSAIISIKDNGIGIRKEDLAKLFNKFYRVPTGNLHNVKGFGLGLYYVQNVSKAHGWSLDVASELNEGTTVSIIIPTK